MAKLGSAKLGMAKLPLGNVGIAIDGMAIDGIANDGTASDGNVTGGTVGVVDPPHAATASAPATNTPATTGTLRIDYLCWKSQTL